MADQLFSVEDQIVLISGGSRGIGWAIAGAFASRDARVIVTGREESPLHAAAAAVAAGRYAVATRVCDVADTAAVERTVTDIVEEFGRIDTLINVAGVNRRKPALEISLDDFDFVLDVNLRGAFWMSRCVGSFMVNQGHGAQINVASLNTERPLKNVLPYAVSKAGLGSMTRALALEWGPSGVRVNAIAPGFILTDLTKALWANPTLQEWGLANTPLRRLGNPQDMAGTAIFLASDAAAFLTGQVLYVDGGFTAGWAWPLPESS